MDYLINDPRLGTQIKGFERARYTLDMTVPDYRNWSIAINLPLDMEVIKFAVFLIDHDAHVVVTTPEDNVNQAMAAFLVTMGVTVYAMDRPDFPMRAEMYKRTCAHTPNLIIDTNYELTGFADSMYPLAAEYLYASMETKVEHPPGFIRAGNIKEVTCLMADSVLTDPSLDKVPLSAKLMRLTDRYIAGSRKARPKKYRFDWLEEMWLVD